MTRKGSKSRMKWFHTMLMLHDLDKNKLHSDRTRQGGTNLYNIMHDLKYRLMTLISLEEEQRLLPGTDEITMIFETS